MTLKPLSLNLNKNEDSLEFLEEEIESSTKELKELEQILIKRINTYCVQVQDARIVMVSFNGFGVNDRLVIMQPIK